MRTAIAWGVVVGVLQAASPLAFWWLDPATVYALGLAVIAFVYIGFAVADGRVRIILVECGVAMAFVVVAAAGITGSAWLLAFGLAAHGVKDAWECSPRILGNVGTPPFTSPLLRLRRVRSRALTSARSVMRRTPGPGRSRAIRSPP